VPGLDRGTVVGGMVKDERESKKWQWGWGGVGWGRAKLAPGQIESGSCPIAVPAGTKCHRADSCPQPATPKGAAAVGAQDGQLLAVPTAQRGPSQQTRMGTGHCPTWVCSQGWHWQLVRPQGTRHSPGGCTVTPSSATYSCQGSGGVGARDAEASGGLAASTMLLKK